MPHEVTWEKRDVWFRFYGDVQFKEIEKAYGGFNADSRFDNQRYLIVDFSDVEKMEFPKEEMEDIVAMDKIAAQTNPYLNAAMVAKIAEIKEVASFYAINSPWDAKAFDNVQDARTWINEQMKKIRK
jgi:hypothetical protein